MPARVAYPSSILVMVPIIGQQIIAVLVMRLSTLFEIPVIFFLVDETRTWVRQIRSEEQRKWNGVFCFCFWTYCRFFVPLFMSALLSNVFFFFLSRRVSSSGSEQRRWHLPVSKWEVKTSSKSHGRCKIIVQPLIWFDWLIDWFFLGDHKKRRRKEGIAFATPIWGFNFMHWSRMLSGRDRDVATGLQSNVSLPSTLIPSLPDLSHLVVAILSWPSFRCVPVHSSSRLWSMPRHSASISVDWSRRTPGRESTTVHVQELVPSVHVVWHPAQWSCGTGLWCDLLMIAKVSLIRTV